MRPKLDRCRATVIQRGDNFEPGIHNHNHAGKPGIETLSTIQREASEWKGLKTKDDDSPRLITVINQRNKIQNMYIVGAGQEIDTNVGILRDGLLCLMYSYYA